MYLILDAVPVNILGAHEDEYYMGMKPLVLLCTYQTLILYQRIYL